MGEEAEKKETLGAVTGCRLVQPLWTTVWQVLKTSKYNHRMTQQCYLGIVVWRKRKHKTGPKTHTPTTFTAALLTTAKLQKQLKCLSINGR